MLQVCGSLVRSAAATECLLTAELHSQQTGSAVREGTYVATALKDVPAADASGCDIGGTCAALTSELPSPHHHALVSPQFPRCCTGGRQTHRMGTTRAGRAAGRMCPCRRGTWAAPALPLRQTRLARPSSPAHLRRRMRTALPARAARAGVCGRTDRIVPTSLRAAPGNSTPPATLAPARRHTAAGLRYSCSFKHSGSIYVRFQGLCLEQSHPPSPSADRDVWTLGPAGGDELCGRAHGCSTPLLCSKPPMFVLIRIPSVLQGRGRGPPYAPMDFQTGSWRNCQAQFCARRQIRLGTRLGNLWREHDRGTACRARLRCTLQRPLPTHPWTSTLAAS